MATQNKRAPRLFTKLKQVFQELPENPSAERVHHLRTNVRRMEALLHVANPELDSKEEKLLKQLSRVRKRAGKVRDIDVQLEALKSLQYEGDQEQKGRVLETLASKRAKKASKLASLVTDSRDQWQKRLPKLRAKFMSGETSTSHNAQEYLRLAQELLSDASSRYGVSNGAGPSKERLHSYRLALKKVRYTAELAGQLPEAEILVKETRRVQDVIGEWHDWEMLLDTAVKELDNLQSSALLAVMRNMTGAKLRSAIRTASEVTGQLVQDSKTGLKKGPGKASTVSAVAKRAANL